MLDQSDIAHYLLSLGLVKPQAVVEENLTVIDASGRNSVFVVAIRDCPTHVVKQGDPSAGRTLAHEAAVLRALGATSELAGYVPTVLRHEPDAERLILRTPEGAKAWSDHYRTGIFPRVPARMLGRVLGTLHRCVGAGDYEPPPGIDPMWGLSLAEPSYALLLDLSAGALDLVARLQTSRALCDRLAALRDAASDGTFVHGDLRWENCLAVAGPGSRRRTRVLLVDWEFAGPGAAGFDVGTVFAEYLRAWVGSIPIVAPDDPGRLVGRAGHPLSRMRPPVQEFWSAYSLTHPGRPMLQRAIELAAVRLLQIAVEQAQGLSKLSAHVVTLLQLADNMLRHPDDAAQALLGLRE